ncbi:MAG: hypothetical protein QW548_02330 [Candidatus Aenigmatarchaeota archaeon]
MQSKPKGVSVIISWLLVAMLVISGIGIVMLATSPMRAQAEAASALSQAEQALERLDAAILSVSREGIGASRIVALPALPGMWQLIQEDDTIEFRLPLSILEPLVRRIRDDMVYISGFDANCSLGSYAGVPALVMENSYLKAYLQRVNGTIDTSQNVLALHSKVTNMTIAPADSSIEINGDPLTSSGTGFSEMRTGVGMPKCRAHFFVDSAAGLSYDIFYTLYSGADFLVVEVRNIT